MNCGYSAIRDDDAFDDGLDECFHDLAVNRSDEAGWIITVALHKLVDHDMMLTLLRGKSRRTTMELGKVKALMRAIEGTYLDLPVEPEGEELLNDGVFAFYARWDMIHMVGEDLIRISGDLRVIDVIEAVHNKG